MAYSESLFTALAAWSVYAVLTRRWVWAGVAGRAGGADPAGGGRGGRGGVDHGGGGAAARAGRWRQAPAHRIGACCPGCCSRRWAGCGYVPLGGGAAPAASPATSTSRAAGATASTAGWPSRASSAGLLGAPPFVAGVALLVAVTALIWLYVCCVRQGQPLPLLVYGGAVLVARAGRQGVLRLEAAAAAARLPGAAAARVGPGPAASGADRAGPRARWRLASAVYGAWWLHGSGPP